MMKKIFLFPLLLLLLLSSCKEKVTNPPDTPLPEGYQQDIPWPSLADSPWPMAHHDPQSTGRSNKNGPLIGNLSWQINIPSTNSAIGFTDFAIGADSTIYFGSSYENINGEQRSYLYAVSTNGNIKWKFSLNYPFVETAPLVATDGTIYIGSGDKNLYAIDLNGKLQWKYTANESIFQAVINIDKTGNIYFTSNDGKLISLDREGHLRWQILPDGGFRSSSESGITFSPDGKSIYVPGNIGSESKSLYAISNEGNILWTFGTGAYIKQPLVDSEGNVYFGYNNSTDSSFYGFLSLNSLGQKRWVYHTDVGAILPTLDMDGNICFAGENGIISLDYKGNLRWEFKSNGFYPTTALSSDNSGNIYYAGSDFIALNNDGTIKYSLPINDFNYSSPAIGFNRIYLGSVNSPKIIYSIK